MFRTTFAVFLAIAALVIPGTASAAPPGNDNFANATAIDPSVSSFSDSVPIDEATAESGEPSQCIYGSSQTVWYSITPSTNGLYRLSRSSSFYYQFAAVWEQTGSGLSGLSARGCVSWVYGSSSMTFSAQAGTTYFIQTGANFGSSGSNAITLQLIAPPANDDFGNAQVVGSLGYSDTRDTTAGTTQAGEPNPSCNFTGQQPAGSIWYRYTPSSDGWVSASTFGSYVQNVVAAYTGDSLGALTERACRTGGRTTLAVQAGQTYSFLVGGLWGGKGPVAFQLNVAPDPIPNFGRSIGDPSIYDTIQFYNFAYDPGDVGISSYEWDFGDGASSTGGAPTHRYATDGTYTVKLTVRTHDGRSATGEQIVVVATHDVAIVKLTVPQSANAGQTRSILVGLSNRRYAETVRVDLYRSTASGFVYFASSTQSVPVRGGNRTTDFAFNYTFTSDDAALGKITFKAVASIVDRRDALLADNEAISLPTKVTR